MSRNTPKTPASDLVHREPEASTDLPKVSVCRVCSKPVELNGCGTHTEFNQTVTNCMPKVEIDG